MSNGKEEKEEKEEEKIAWICKEVIRRIKPTEEERRKVRAVIDQVVGRVNKKAKEMDIDAHAASVGSAARNTWVNGEEDIDIFIMFPEDMSEDDLKEKGLSIAKSISEKYEERYASHPYIHAYFCDEEGEEHEVDLVPCFSIKNASRLKSAVDRTPFHNEYVMKRISGLEEEVLLLKQFMKSIGIYGSEQRRKGFSGYLCELLIQKHSSFIELLKTASNWKYGERIDIEGEGKYKGEDPLIVIDPVDPKRNVAAAVSLDSFCSLINASREFLAKPDLSFFFPEKKKEMSKEEFMKTVKERGTEIVMVLFEAPDVVEDILFPQLRKAESSISNLIERNGFKVYRSDVSAEGDKAFLIFELLIWNLPRVKKHAGPPVALKYHSETFKRRYASTSCPLFIENGRYVVEIERKYRNVVELVKNELKSCSLGKHISEAIDKGYEVLSTEEITFFEGLGSFFTNYFYFSSNSSSFKG